MDRELARKPRMQARLSEKSILPAYQLRRIGGRVLVFDELDSTNAYLLGHAAEINDGAVVVAEFQTAGRGRLGRRWLSPRGASVLLSVLLKEPLDSPWLGRATLAAALAACEAVEAVTACRPGLHWPNDLVLSGKKLGGVLVESTPLARNPHEPAAQRAVVVGIGVNCLQQRGHLPGEIADTATSLEIESASPVDRVAVARSLLERLDAHFAPPTISQPAWTEVLAAWKSRCEDLGSRVTLQQDRPVYTGTVLDVSDDGDLLVQLDQGRRRYFAAATTTRLR
jgi:BirA family transcriptional regulator, biotin operon repressor / biotin---[acetyl-CoA-carboxylase] ligase